MERRLGCCVVLIPCVCLPSTATLRGTVAFVIVIVVSTAHGAIVFAWVPNSPTNPPVFHSFRRSLTRDGVGVPG